VVEKLRHDGEFVWQCLFMPNLVALRIIRTWRSRVTKTWALCSTPTSWGVLGPRTYHLM